MLAETHFVFWVDMPINLTGVTWPSYGYQLVLPVEPHDLSRREQHLAPGNPSTRIGHDVMHVPPSIMEQEAVYLPNVPISGIKMKASPVVSPV